MKSPASSAASKRSSATASSAERTAMRSSFGAVSLAWVSISGSLLMALAVDSAGLAYERSLDAVRQPDLHGGRHAGHRLDAFLQVAGDLCDVGLELRGQQLAQHLDLVEQALARDHELVLPAER